MLSRKDLEAICLRVEAPLKGMEKDLEALRAHALETKADAVSYAVMMLRAYETAVGRIESDLANTRNRVRELKDQYSRRSQTTDSIGTFYDDDPGFSLNDVDRRLVDAISAAQSKKYEVVKTLQRELAGRSVDVRTKRHMVILKTNDGVYGFYLHDAERHMRGVNHIPTPFGPFYWLVGETYHIPKIVGR